jgi:hypothetical protein
MPGTGVKALRFFKGETVDPTSTMIIPIEPNITALSEPCNLIAQIHPSKLRKLPKNAAGGSTTRFLQSHRSIIGAFNVKRFTTLMLLSGSKV